MTEQLRQLQDLEAQLHEINREFSRAAEPLAQQPELDFEQRREVAARLRKAQTRWEAVTRQIAQVLQTTGAQNQRTIAEDGSQ